MNKLGLTKIQEDDAFEQAWESDREDLSNPKVLKKHLIRTGMAAQWKSMSDEERILYMRLFSK